MLCCNLVQTTCFVHGQFVDDIGYLIRSYNHIIIKGNIFNIKILTLDTIKNVTVMFSPALYNIFCGPEIPSILKSSLLLLRILTFFQNSLTLLCWSFLAMELALMACSFLLIKRTAYLNLTFVCFLCSHSGPSRPPCQHPGAQRQSFHPGLKLLCLLFG